MFHFALESEAVTLSNPEADHKVAISADFVKSVNEAVLDGIIFSLVKSFERSGLDAKSINEKISELINTLKIRGDVSKRYANWRDEDSHADSLISNIRSRLYKNYPSWSGEGFYSVMDSACWGGYWGFLYDTKELQLNDREKEIVSRYRDAKEAFYKARREFSEYAEDCALEQFNIIMTKYGDAISKVNSEWYTGVMEILKREMEYLEKRRQEAKAEKTSAVGRVVDAK